MRFLNKTRDDPSNHEIIEVSLDSTFSENQTEYPENDVSLGSDHYISGMLREKLEFKICEGV